MTLLRSRRKPAIKSSDICKEMILGTVVITIIQGSFQKGNN